jgi:hypothetical protein
MVTIFMVNEDIARGMVCFFHQKKHSYLIFINSSMLTSLSNILSLLKIATSNECCFVLTKVIGPYQKYHLVYHVCKVSTYTVHVHMYRHFAKPKWTSQFGRMVFCRFQNDNVGFFVLTWQAKVGLCWMKFVTKHTILGQSFPQFHTKFF